MFKFGVDPLIWTEEFMEKDLPLIEKAKTWGSMQLTLTSATLSGSLPGR